jgi:signal transduction histidine kinase
MNTFINRAASTGRGVKGRMPRMPERLTYLYFLASAGNLFLATLVTFRARRARGALPIALLCVALFLWDIGEGLYEATGTTPETRNPVWHYLRLIGSSMAPAFLWHFVLVFVHKERRHRKWLVVLYAATGVFTLMTAGALVSPALRDFVDGKVWNLTYLAVLFPFLVWSFLLVRARLREVETSVERNALLFVAVGIFAGTLTGLTDLTKALGSPIPKLGHVGSVLCTLVLAIAILRHRLLEQQTPVRKVLFVFLLAASVTVVYAVLSNALPDAAEPYFVSAVVGTVTLLALYRMVFVRWYEQAERRKRLALIGTMAAGVAHEIRNPLAAIKGAAQFVQKELEGSDAKPEARDYLKLVVDEVDRLNGVVESFLTYARPLDPRRQDVSLPSLLGDIARLQAASLPPSVRLETDFDGEMPPVSADPALLTQAVTNVLRNAVEAMPEGGPVRLRTRTVVTALRTFAAIEVTDAGSGIPPDDLERIFQPFYTTKSKGTGLGLAIALRILEAHGGDIAVENVPPRGCRFTFLLPLPVL